jgi:DNA-binding NarL/FixJ family response regulator
MRRVRVVLVSAFPVFSEGLGVAMSREEDLEFCGSATTSEDAARLTTEAQPDVVVIDIDVVRPTDGVADGIDIARIVKEVRPSTRVLILGDVMELEIMARAAAQGVCGFLSKSSTLEEICVAARTAKDGGIYVEGELVLPLLNSIRQTNGRHNGGSSSRIDLTPRELEVLTLLGEGNDVAAIAKRLDISLNTTRGHVKNVLLKLGCHSQLEAVIEAVREGLLPHLAR